MCNWWKCADCKEEFEKPQGAMGEGELFCPMCRSNKVYCMEDEEEEIKPSSEDRYVSGLFFDRMPTLLGAVDLKTIAPGCIGVAPVFDNREDAENFTGKRGTVILVQTA